MRHYCQRWRNIANRMAAAALLGGLCAGGPAGASAAASVIAAATNDAAAPAVSVASLQTSGSQLIAEISAAPGGRANTLNFVLAIPDVNITSATLTIQPGAAANTEYAPQPVAVRSLGYIRGSHLLQLSAPARMPGSREAITSGVLTLQADADITVAGAHVAANDLISTIVAQLVANPHDVSRFAVPLDRVPAPTDNLPGPPLGGYPDAVARFTVDHGGFVCFTGRELAAAGVDLANTDVTSISLWADGEQAPVMPETAFAEGRTTIALTDTFLTYTRDPQSTYSRTTDYWLRLNAGPPRLMNATIQGASAPPDPAAHFMAETTIEHDTPPVLTQNDQFLSILGYRWVWWTWTPEPTPALPDARTFAAPGQISFNLDGLAKAPDTTASLTLHFYGHRFTPEMPPVPISVSLNGKPVAVISVNDGPALTQQISVPASALRATSNTLTLAPTTSATAARLPDLCFDRLDVRYPRTYELTSDTLHFAPPTPTGGSVILRHEAGAKFITADLQNDDPTLMLVKGAYATSRTLVTEGPADHPYLAIRRSAIPAALLKKYAPATDLRSTATRADIVVIAWPEFLPEMRAWADRKTAAGHSVALVSVQEVYDQFGYGSLSPHAIRAFLRYAALNWQAGRGGAPASTVILVGDSTSAYRNEFRNDVINYVPTMRIINSSDPYASDQWFVCNFGDDFLADALIGRFSVNSVKDLRALLRKQLDYETGAATGPWQNTLGFIADHSEFADSVERVMAQAVPPRFFLKPILMDKLPWVDNYYFPKEIAEARKAKVSPAATGLIKDLFNDGAAVVTYFGHGSPNIWSTQRMWFGGDSPNSDNLLLTNRDRLPIVINMTCNSGAIDYPQPRWNVCISEDFMRVPNGGAVACFVPSGPGLTVQHERLMMEIGPLLFGERPQPLGQSLQLALWRYLAAGNPSDLARMFILLGDPLLVPHIAAAAPFDAAAPTTGGLALPAPLQQQAGHYQVTTYGDAVAPDPITAFTTGTTTLPISLPSDKPAAVALAGSVTSGTVSQLASYASPAALQLVQWEQVASPSASAGDSIATAALKLTLRNMTPVSATSAKIQLFGENSAAPVAASDAFTVAPQSEATITIPITLKAGLQPLTARVQLDGRAHTLKADPPLAVVGIRTAAAPPTLPPAVVDPRSITVRYIQGGQGVSAVVSAQVYALAREALSNLRIGLADPEGVVLPQSIVTVPPMSPGHGARVTLSADVTTATATAAGTAAAWHLRFDPSGYYPEFIRFAPAEVRLGPATYPDLAIAAIAPSEQTPVDGETVFFDVTLQNLGSTAVEGVSATGYLLPAGNSSADAAPTDPALPAGAKKLESQALLEPERLTLPPATSATIRLRWDPFHNAGANPLLFRADSAYAAPDANPANNQKRLTLNVLTKARIRAVQVGVSPLTPQDVQNRQVRFIARVKNEGQSAAQGLNVLFYAQKAMTPENYLGETEIPVVPPGEIREAILTYKLKPGEENRPFHITCEVMYKGSRQRLPLVP